MTARRPEEESKEPPPLPRPARMSRETTASTAQARDLALYERLISRGIAEADARGSAIDHVTARRLALWLLPRSQQEPEFMRGLITFAHTGAVTHDLRQRLRHHARSPGHPARPHAARLLQYAVARGKDTGRIGDNFGAVCDQIDRADAMLDDLRNRVAASRACPEPARPQRQPPEPIAIAHHDDPSQTVILILDTVTADAAIHAVTGSALDREARIRRTRQASQNFPEGSYGRHNREAVIARETRIAQGLRATEHAYRAAIEPETTPAPELSQILPASDRASDREQELG